MNRRNLYAEQAKMKETNEMRYLILVVEESANRLGFYDSDTGRPAGHVDLSLWPHEVAVAPDGIAYVSNFGIRDYDLSLGYAGNSVSIVDVAKRCEVGRLYTHLDGEPFWGPHGVKVSPSGGEVLVNVERVLGIRGPDLARPGSEYTKLLRFQRASGRCEGAVEIDLPAYDPRGRPVSKFEDPSAAYDVVPGTHNFVYSPHDPNELWLFSGRQGVSVMDLTTGQITARLENFSGAVRALSFGTKTGALLVNATNEVSLVDPSRREVVWQLGELGVGQLLYGKLTPDEQHILTPAVWEGQLLVISVKERRVLHRLNTGIDPVQVEISPDNRRAYVTHGRSRWLTYIELDQLDRVAGRVETRGGPNGVAFAPYSPAPDPQRLRLLALLPFTGELAVAGRELRLGYQFWKDSINDAGGVVFDGARHLIDVEYVDTTSSTSEAVLRELVRESVDGAPPLAVLGSYPPRANRWIGLECNELDIPFITGLRSSPSLFGEDRAHVTSLAPARSCVSEGVLLALRNHVSPSPQTIAVLLVDTPDAREETTATADAARDYGFSVIRDHDGRHFSFLPGGEGLEEAVSRLGRSTPDLIVVVGGIVDCVLGLRAIERANLHPGGIAVTCEVTNAVFQAKAGSLGDGVLGGVDWSSETTVFSEDRVGASEDFARQYFERYSERPSSFAAGAAAAMGALERAISLGASAETLATALRTLYYESFYGHVRIDETGRNVGMRISAVQLSFSSSGEARARRIWPRGPSVGRPNWPRP